ncbi:transposase [Candidatus Berkelbacteria bacterium]|nr:transposase [Candidatus Berkelbacteria bacterium]
MKPMDQNALPSRKTEVGHFYHVYNRGEDKRDIYLTPAHYEYFLLALDYYRDSQVKLPLSQINATKLNPTRKIEEPLVKLLCYFAMPNHFHLLIQEQSDQGVSKYLADIQNSYTKYFNKMHQRTGHLFQGRYRIVRIETEEQLLIVSRYVHLQAVTANLREEIEYPWSSIGGYLATSKTFCDTELILRLAKTTGYRVFLENYKDYARTLAKIKHLLHE